MKLHRELGITQKTAWIMTQKIRGGWDRSKRTLKGVVEVDEVYIGGKESNKHGSKKLNAGRGSVGKAAVVGIKELGGEIRPEPVPDSSANTLLKQLLSQVEIGSTVYSDEHRGYQGVGAFFKHETVKHSVGEYVEY